MTLHAKNLALVAHVEAYFKDEVVCVVQGGRYHDITVIVTASPTTPEKQQAFFAFLINYSIDPNKVQIKYREDLMMSLNGYGYVRQNGSINTDRITPKTKNIFNTYREMLGFFGSPSQLLTTNIENYHAFVELAKITIVTIALTNFGTNAFTFAEFLDKLSNADDGLLDIDNPEVSQMYLEETFKPTVDQFVKNKVLSRNGNTFNVIDLEALALPYIKDQQQLLLEQQYLGVHESPQSWDDFMQDIAFVGLQAYQTERPLDYQTPSELKSHVDTALPAVGVNSVKTLITEMNDLVNRYSINQSTVNFMAFPEAGNSKAAVAASMLIPLWNQNVISVDKSAPIGTFIEIQVIEWLRRIVGYDCAPTTSAENIGGVAATGGVMSNTVGLLVARSLVFPDSRKKGLLGVQKTPHLLIASRTLEHYSHKAAFWWLGLGEDNVIPVKSDGFNFDITDLRKKISIYNSGDNVVVAVVCMAGDSRTMAIQNIREIHAETSKHNIWLHIDACQGGVGLFSSKKDELCGDYKLADSISIDPHKGLGVPYSSSFCLFKDQDVLKNISKSTDITIAKGSYDIGQVTPFLGSRPFDTLKLWSLMKYHGLDGLAQNVDYRIELTKEWAVCLNDSASFISLNDPTLTAVSFSIDPHKLHLKDVDAIELSAINKALHDSCYKAGWLVVHGFDLIDYENRLGLSVETPIRVLGTNFGNVLLDKNHFPKIIAYMESQLQEIMSRKSEIIALNTK